VFSPTLLDCLQQIFKDYFDKEENLMFRIDYPNADKNMLSHSVMLTSLEIAVLEHKKSGDRRLIIDFISDNYVNHLMSEETSLASFIQNKRKIQAARLQKTKPLVRPPTIQASRPTTLTSRR
jgi:hemerythrin